MKEFISHLRGAIMSTLVLAVVCCGIYPVVVWGISQAVFKDKADGSLITDKDGTIRGSRLLAQGFSSDKYFAPRQSNAGAGYDATSSGGTNLGPTSDKLANGVHVKDDKGKDKDDTSNFDGIKDLVAAYRSTYGLKDSDPVPADAVTRSASGLDPHISPRNAELQAARVAKARNLSVDKVKELIRAHTDGPDLGLFGDPGVNVLTLNMALDAIQPSAATQLVTATPPAPAPAAAAPAQPSK
jgi:potassium-transporting ATPase KdpC subunit